MKYVDKWPDAKPNEEPVPGIFKAERPQPCVMCKRPTRWVNLNWMANLCSEECEQRLQEGYAADRKKKAADFWGEEVPVTSPNPLAEENPDES